MTLSDRLQATGTLPHRRNAGPWLDAHPDVAAEIDQALRAGYGVPAILRELRRQYAFPYSEWVLRRRWGYH